MNRDRVAVEPVAETSEARSAIVGRAYRRGFRHFVVRGAADLPLPEGCFGLTHQPSSLGPMDRPEAIPIVEVEKPADIERAAVLGRKEHGIAIRWTAERVIPLENLIASARREFEIWVLVERLRDLPAMLGALEHGADHLVVEVRDPGEVDQVESALDEVATGTIPWELNPVHRVEPAGLGDRVIVDTTSILRSGEGLLVGSAAAFLFHVASEAVGSRFTRPRPFRVNAGAAHSYVLLADGTTRYLSELQPGDRVLVAEPRGRLRSIRVGRIKVERRPLAMIEIERDHRRYTVFVQDAETVRLSGEHDRIATVDLAVGDRVFGSAFPPARHLGGVVDETIDER